MAIGFGNGEESSEETVTMTSSSGSVLSGPIQRPPSDNREYRGLTLSNGMKVILVSDPTTTKSAASLAIPAGLYSLLNNILFFFYKPPF